MNVCENMHFFRIQETDAEMLRAEKETQQKIQLKNQQFEEHMRELKVFLFILILI